MATTRVLHIDDNSLDLELVRDALEKEDGGFKVTSVSSEAGFRREIATNSYDIVLTDYYISGFDGLKVLEIMRDNRLGIPVIMLTGTGSEEIAVQAIKLHAEDYVLKTGHNIRRLPQIIRSVLEKTHLRRSLELQHRELVASEERFRIVSEATNDAVWDWDLGTNSLWWNDGVLTLFGYTAAQMGNDISGWSERIHPQDQQRVVDGIHAVISGDGARWSDEYRFLRLDGSFAHVLDRGKVIRDQTGRAVRMIGAMMDITARRQAEEALRRESNFSNAILNSLPGVVYCYNKNLRFLRWNKNLETVLGYNNAEIARMSPLDFFDGSDRELIAIKIQQVFEKGMSDAEADFVTRDGRRIPYYFTGMTIEIDGEQCLVGVGIDITERKQFEAALRESEERHRIVTRATNDIVWDWNLEDDTHWMNDNFQIAFGYTAHEIEPGIKVWENRLHPEDQKNIINSIHGMIDSGGHYWSGEYRLRRADGSYAHIHDRGYLIRDGEGKPRRMIGAMADITERKLAEQKLKVFRTLLDRSNDAIEILDPGTGRFLDVNEKSCTELGYSREELLNLSVFDIDPMVDRDLFAKNRDTLQKSESMIWEGIHKRKDGSIFPVEVNIKYVRLDQDYLVTIVRDITERKMAEQKIRLQVEHLGLLDQITRAIGERQDIHSIYQIVLSSLEHGLHLDFGCIGVYDQNDHIELLMSAGSCKPAGLDLQAQPRLDIHANGFNICLQGKLIYEPDVSQIFFPFLQNLAAGGLGPLVMAPLRVKDTTFGILFTARAKDQIFSSGECEFLRQLCDHVALAMQQSQLYDALQSAYEDLRQTQQSVMQQERLRALGQMASGIAHDINNALSPVALFTESILETEKNLSAKARGHLEIIQRAVDDVAQSIERMRDFYRQREPQVTQKPVQVNHLVEEVLGLCQARFEMPQQHGIVITVRKELAHELPDITGIESEIREALVNLIFNAVDAMPEGGAITIRTSTTTLPEHTAPSAVTIEVTDTGIGMDEETRQRCLEPFFSTKGERGTGLGLAMVYGMIQRHFSKIEIDSTPGAGTTVRLLFPITATGLNEPAQSFNHPVPTGLRLLLVDDDPILLKTIQHILEIDGHLTVAAGNGQTGIDTFIGAIKEGHPFDAVITDLGMPYIDGRHVAAAVKQAAPATPVILLTGWGQRMLAENDIPPHVDYVLSKPPKLQQLRNTLALCCRFAHAKPTE